MPSIQLPVHSYRLNSITAANSRLINCFAEVVPEGKQPIRLTRAPGIATFSSPTAGLGRGVGYALNALYAVVGGTLYSVSSAGVATSIGSILGSGPCWLTANSTQLVVGQDSGTWYVYDGTTLSTITDTDFTSRGAKSAQFIDNYISFVEPVSGRWFISDLAAATSYDSLNFATAEGAPDNLVTHAVDHREAVLFGESSTELWYNAGASGFPFERSPGGFLELGALAVRGHCKADNSIFWLASDYTIRRLVGQTPQRVSHHGFEERIRTYSTVADCESYSYTFNGHICAVFRFPTAAATWVFDVTTGELHERQSYGSGGWNISGITDAYGRVIVQNANSGALGYLDSSTYTEFGAIQRAEWTYQNVYSENTRFPHSSLEMVCETGVGLATGQGSDPQITLEISNDGGRTYTTLPTRTIGAQGHYLTRVKWNRLGLPRDRVYRGSISDPVQLSVTDTILTT